MTSSESAEKLDWRVLLQAVGSQVVVPENPQRSVCPLCGKHSLLVYSDTKADAWYHCRGCGVAVDGLGLAMKTWRLSAEDAASRLSVTLGRRIVFDAAGRESQECLREFCGNLRSPSEQHPDGDTPALYRTLTIRTDPFNLTRQATRLKALFGFSAMGKVLDATSGRTPPQDNVPAKRKFTAGGWQETAVVPFCDLPGRVVGCLTVAIAADKSGAEVRYHPARRSAGTGGLAFLNRLPLDEQKVVICDDVVFALKLYAKHHAESPTPLPLLGAWLKGSNGCLPNTGMLGLNSRAVLWSPQPSPQLFAAAIASGLPVSLAGPVHSDIGKYARRYSPIGLTELITRQAEPWESAIAKFLARSSQSDAESFLVRTGVPPAALNRIAEGYGVAAVAARALKPRASSGTVVISGKTIIADDGRWRCGLAEIASADIRISKIIRFPIAGTTVYDGVINLPGGAAVPFHDPVATVSRNPASWLRDRVIDAGHPPPLVDRRWAKRLVEIAEAMHRPSAEIATERVGWDEAARAWNFPNFTASAKSAHGDRPAFYATELPATLVPVPQATVAVPVGRAKHLAWAVVTIIAAAMLARRTQLIAPPVVATDARSWSFLQRLLQACGRCDIPGHDWPVSLGHAPYRKLAALPANSIVWSSVTGARVSGFFGHVVTFTADRNTTLADVGTAAVHVPRILAAWIHDLCKSDRSITTWPDAFLTARADLDAWGARQSFSMTPTKSLRCVTITGPERAALEVIKTVNGIRRRPILNVKKGTGYVAIERLRKALLQLGVNNGRQVVLGLAAALQTDDSGFIVIPSSLLSSQVRKFSQEPTMLSSAINPPSLSFIDDEDDEIDDMALEDDDDELNDFDDDADDDDDDDLDDDLDDDVD
jgi:hypothetical protein